MSHRDSQDPAFQELVKSLAEAVLRELGVGEAARAAEPGGRRIAWLLAAPAGHLGALVREMAVLQRIGHGQTVLGCADAVTALRAEALPGGVLVRDPAGSASGLLEAVGEAELLYIGALGWQQARDLAALRDGDEFVAAALEALARDVPVRVVVGDALGGLHRFGPETRVAGRLGSEAAQRWRELRALGIDPVAVEALGAPLARLEADRHSWGRALGGLLTEQDVEAAVGEGRSELVLPGGTVVTPLARDRARELGVVIRRS